MRYFLWIPHWHPVLTNTLLRTHWARRGRLLRTDASMVRVYALLCHTPQATTPRRVSLHLHLKPRQRASDPDSRLKSLLDALVGAQLLVDDSPRWCTLGSVEHSHGGEWGTEIVLEDLASAQ